MQEIKCTDDKFPRKCSGRGYHYQIFGQQTYNGVAILTRESCATDHRGYPGDAPDAQSRLIASTVKRHQHRRCLRAKWPDGWFRNCAFKLDWMSRFGSFFIQTTQNTPVLLCGDFSVAPEDGLHDVRLWRGRILSVSLKTALQHIKDWGFTDAFRLHTEAAGHYS
jgi:exodeoxyribonuclease-3